MNRLLCPNLTNMWRFKVPSWGGMQLSLALAAIGLSGTRMMELYIVMKVLDCTYSATSTTGSIPNSPSGRAPPASSDSARNFCKPAVTIISNSFDNHGKN